MSKQGSIKNGAISQSQRQRNSEHDSTKRHLMKLVRTYQGMEQRSLCPLLGCCIHHVKKLVDELISDGKLERRINTSGVATLCTAGYQASRGRQVRMPQKKWNDCRFYVVPKDQILTYRDPDKKIPKEYLAMSDEALESVKAG